MKRNKIVLLFLVATIAVQAEIKLPAIFADNMLMQQNTQVNIWGKAAANKTVTIKTSWSKKVLKTTSDASGNWKTSIPTPEADGKAHKIIFSDGKTLVLNNILLGEL